MGYDVPTARELAKLGNLELAAKYNEIAARFPAGERPKRIARFESRERGVERVRELIKRLRLAKEQLAEKIPVAKFDPEEWVDVSGSVPSSVVETEDEIEDRTDAAIECQQTPRRRRRNPPLDRKGGGIPLLPCRAGSMAATLVDLLSRPDGATLDELAAATSSSIDEVRSKGLCWWLPYHGYGSRKSGESYYLVVPNGQEIPGHISR